MCKEVMEIQNTLKVENGSQRLESPLDVLSRAASMIQKESSNITEGNKAKDGKDFVTYVSRDNCFRIACLLRLFVKYFRESLECLC